MKDQLQVKPQQNLDSYRSLCSPSSKSTTGGKSRWFIHRDRKILLFTNRNPEPDAYYHSRLSLCSSDEEEDDQEEDDDEDDDETDETLYQKFKAQGPILADHLELTKKYLDTEA